MHSTLLVLSFPRPRGGKERGNKAAGITTTDEMQNPSRKLLSSGSAELHVARVLSAKANLAPGARSLDRRRSAWACRGQIRGIPAAAALSTPAGKVGRGERPEERNK